MPVRNNLDFDPANPLVAWEIEPELRFGNAPLLTLARLSLAGLRAATTAVFTSFELERVTEPGSVPDMLRDRYSLLEGRDVCAVRAAPAAYRDPDTPVPIDDIRRGLYAAQGELVTEAQKAASELGIGATDIAPYIALLLVPPPTWGQDKIWIPD